MATHCCDFAVVDEHHLVHQAEGGGPVGDDDGRTALHDVLECCQHLGFDDGVDRRGGIIKNQHPGVPEHRPGKGNPLALAAGQ